jgi:hypothetical protein
MGYQVRAFFSIGLSINDKNLLDLICKFFGDIGSIHINYKNSSIQWIVTDLGQLTNIVIPHFIKYPLISQKASDFQLFILAVNLINSKAHLTQEGFYQILSIKASMNLGLSDKLQTLFLKVTPMARPLISLPLTINPNWLAGLTEAEGCFDIKISQSDRFKTGFQIHLRFRITQHIRDKSLLKLIISYLNCGKLYVRSNKLACDIEVNNFKDIPNLIIPFFDQYPLYGLKRLNFLDFRSAMEMVQRKEHLTAEGLARIQLIKASMNRSRTIE